MATTVWSCSSSRWSPRGCSRRGRVVVRRPQGGAPGPACAPRPRSLGCRRRCCAHRAAVAGLAVAAAGRPADRDDAALIGAVGVTATWAGLGPWPARGGVARRAPRGATPPRARVPRRDVAGGAHGQPRRDVGRRRGHHDRHRLPRRPPRHAHGARGGLEVRRARLGRHRDRVARRRAALRGEAQRGRGDAGLDHSWSAGALPLDPGLVRVAAGPRGAGVRDEGGPGADALVAARRAQPGAGAGLRR